MSIGLVRAGATQQPEFGEELESPPRKRVSRFESIGARCAAGALVTLMAMQLTGCGAPAKPTIKPDSTAQFITDGVSKQAGFHPTDVTCPSDVVATVGGEFDCHFTGPDGPYTAHMRITKVDGTDVVFDWKALPDHPDAKPNAAVIAARVIADGVAKGTGFRPSDVTCPSDVVAKVGEEFDCHFTGPDDSYAVHMLITNAEGNDVEFGRWVSLPDHQTVEPAGAAQRVVDFVATQTGFHPDDVTRPSGVSAKVGTEFDCHFTGPDGSYIAHMRITRDDGKSVDFDIQTLRG